jgi:Zn ribbon nucleic-acid-binding protein
MTTPREPTKLTCKSPDCGKEFIVIASEEKFYEQKNLPLPDHCPACRHKERMALRSERQLYRRTCDKCGKSMLSVYPQEAPYVVYCHACFWANIE